MRITSSSLGADGTLALILRRNPDFPPLSGAKPSDRYLLSAAHVLASGSINHDDCSASGSAEALAEKPSAFPELDPDALTELGPIVEQSCLRTSGNTSDGAIAQIYSALGADVVIDPAGFDPLSSRSYRIVADTQTPSDHIANHDPVVRFGAISGVATGKLGDPAERLSLSLAGVQDDLTYSGLVRYTSAVDPEDGDSGALIAAVLFDGAGQKEITIAAVAIHIGVDRSGNPVCYPLDVVVPPAWEVAYDA
jgi:hypothetical protein